MKYSRKYLNILKHMYRLFESLLFSHVVQERERAQRLVDRFSRNDTDSGEQGLHRTKRAGFCYLCERFLSVVTKGVARRDRRDPLHVETLENMCTCVFRRYLLKKYKVYTNDSCAFVHFDFLRRMRR